VVFVNARVAAIGQVMVPEAEARRISTAASTAPRARRKIFLRAWREVDVYALDDLRPGHRLFGPAIIEAETTTVLIDDGDALTVNTLGWLDIRVAAS
jgi:N-methylhydantoinase A